MKTATITYTDDRTLPAQIPSFGRDSDCHVTDQITVQNGGYSRAGPDLRQSLSVS
jgi:hypothetical protein